MVERGVAYAERIEVRVAPVGVAEPRDAVVGWPALVTRAHCLARDGAGMWREGSGDGVGLPDIDLVAAGAGRA